jgi:hypothetical protein
MWHAKLNKTESTITIFYILICMSLDSKKKGQNSLN